MPRQEPSHGDHCFCRTCNSHYAEYMARQRERAVQAAIDHRQIVLDMMQAEADAAVPCTDREWLEYLDLIAPRDTDDQHLAHPVLHGGDS